MSNTTSLPSSILKKNMAYGIAKKEELKKIHLMEMDHVQQNDMKYREALSQIKR